MSAPVIVALLLAVAATLAAWRRWQSPRRHRAWWTLAYFVAAALLYATLFPMTTRKPFTSGDLVVLTAGTTDAQRAALSRAQTIVALPGAPAPNGAERVPDLGTALRRHPESVHLAVVGGGLSARDRDAAREHLTRFDAAPLPRGIVELSPPREVRAGAQFAVTGRVEDARGGRVELRDPAGALVDSMSLDDDGRFVVRSVAKTAGNTLFELRAFAADGAAIDAASVPVAARSGDALKVLVLAGAPDAELKYLRRWAVDAGVALDSRIILSTGVALTEGTAPERAQRLEEATLQALDLVVIDERAWLTLAAASKTALADAVRSGLGLLVRITGSPDASVVADLAALGLHVSGGDTASAVKLAKSLGLGDVAPVFTRRVINVEANDAAPLLRSDDHAALAMWRSVGAGRVALWPLIDTYKLALAGDAAAFGTLWSHTLMTVARARGTAAANVNDNARVDQRIVLCGITANAFVEDDRAARAVLTTMPNGRGVNCAAYWPSRVGWHTLINGSERVSFYVRAGSAASALARGEDDRATRALLTASSSTETGSATREMPLPRWPFFIAWLLAMTALWIGERNDVAIAHRS